MRHGRGVANGGREEGASAVEFAVLLPLLIMLVFGIVEFGIVFGQDLALSNGARQGARIGVAGPYPGAGSDPADCAEIFTSVRNGATTLGVAPADVDVEVFVNGSSKCSTPSGVEPCSGSPAGAQLRVQATFETSLNIPMVVTRTFDLEREGTFRCEYQ